MEFVKTYKQNLRPVVFLISEPEPLAVYILESLLSSLCKIVIFSKDPRGWKTFTSYIARNENIIFDSINNYNKYPKPNYFLLIDLSKTNPKDIIEKGFVLRDAFNSKGFLVVSGESGSYFQGFELPESLGVVIVKDLFGPRMVLNNGNWVSKVISSAVHGEKIKVADNERVSPLYLGDAAKTIVKWLFSFGPYGETILLTSKEELLVDFCRVVKETSPEFNYTTVRGLIKTKILVKGRVYSITKDYRRLIKEAISWFKEQRYENNVVTPKKTNTIKIYKAVIATVTLLLSPFAFILIAAILVLIPIKLVSLENVGTSKVFLKASLLVSDIAAKESTIFVRAPLLGRVYKPALSFSYILKNTSRVGIRSVNLVASLKDLLVGIVEEGDYDLAGSQEKISADLSFIETTLSFIETEAGAYPKIYRKIDIAQIKKLASNLSRISLSLSDILGKQKTKTYLMLFQNNMELRPTGGFIGSFALISFGAGKLTDIVVQDVYSADGQLKGHVEPPEPIKKYLKEANWFLRDSNWNPDFPVSAARAEWFLDKEIDVYVDGVIAIDLNLIKDLLEVVGPIYLDDYKMQITKDNFYEITQSQVETGFFPGSTKKASFITALSKEMISTLLLNKDKNGSKLARIFYENLESRHIQIFLHNNAAKNALSNLNWDGGFNYSGCDGNCTSDFLGLVEANLGVNKSNYYVGRTYNLEVDFQEGVVKKNLSVSFKNSANPAVGERGVYKTYTRLFVPTNSVLGSLQIDDRPVQSDIDTVSGMKEIGFYMEVLPGQTKTVNILWQEQTGTTINKEGKYLLYVRKQAGVGDEPISILYNFPSGIDLNIEHGYNTLFSKDIYAKVSWKK